MSGLHLALPVLAWLRCCRREASASFCQNSPALTDWIAGSALPGDWKVGLERLHSSLSILREFTNFRLPGLPM